jgi:hypothetical protein
MRAYRGRSRCASESSVVAAKAYLGRWLAALVCERLGMDVVSGGELAVCGR